MEAVENGQITGLDELVKRDVGGGDGVVDVQ